MLFRTTIDGLPATISHTDRAVTVSRNDEWIVAWDLGGRLYSVVEGDVTCRRGLNGRMLMKWRHDGERQRAWASPADADAIVERSATLAAAAMKADVATEAAAALALAARFDSRAAAADATAFAEVYQPIGILPPDQYLALVLQATEGCSFRSCTFCDLYRGSYAVKDRVGFAAHVAGVRAYLGASLSLRARGVFLGSANALAVPMSGLLPLVEVVRAEFPGRPIYAFLDGFTGVRKHTDDYAALAACGLRRVYIGLESGHDALLAFVRKPSTSGQAIETVRTLKSAGVNVGVIVMIGLGGGTYAEAHVADTAEAVNEMGLGRGDLLYFSDLVDVPGTLYVSDASHIRALDVAERRAQRRAIESGLVFPSGRPQIATYDVREFIY